MQIVMLFSRVVFLYFSYLIPICFSSSLLTVEAEKKRPEKIEAEAAQKIEEDARGDNAC